MDIYYVYQYLRSKNSQQGQIGTPYYIGKGTKNRAYHPHDNIKKPPTRSNIQIISEGMNESDALRGAVAGWSDDQGLSAVMSQFINVKEGVEGAWHIHVTSPKLDLTLLDEFKQPSVAAGFVSEKDKQGFCVLNKLDLVSIMLQSSTMPS